MLDWHRSRAARMSSSVIIRPSSVQTFDLYPLRYRMLARTALEFPAGATANLLRGRLGKALRSASPELYDRFFAPHTGSGPSGLRDSPRPFVLRVRHLEGSRFASGDLFEIGVNLFEMRHPPLEELREALCAATSSDCAAIDGMQPLRLSLEPPSSPVSCVRVRFLTPTELKPADHPEFSVLFARLRDRISTLRALYGPGPLEIDFRAMAGRAAAIRLSRCELWHIEAERVSRATGQRHSLGGFTGIAEYSGDLAEFIPYLEIARWTGVGRQTVWGKGELAGEII
jgi:hypothetical protein